MPEEKQTDDIEKVLSDLKSIEARKDRRQTGPRRCHLRFTCSNFVRQW
jgi:hypothetical protein